MLVKIIIIVVGLIFVAAFAFGSYYYRRKLLELRSIELLPLADLEEGKCKASGEVVAIEKPLKSPITGTPCVWYSFVVTEERETEETYTTREGNRKVTRTRTRIEHVQIFSDVRSVAFNIKDDTGEAEIEMENAETFIKSKERSSSGKMKEISSKARDRIDDLYPNQARILGKRCRFTETVIEEGDTLLVMGEVSFSKSKPPLFAYEKKKPLLVSDQSDEQLQRSFKMTSIWLAVGAAAFLVGTILGAIFIGGK